jgi:hypothetical protein
MSITIDFPPEIEQGLRARAVAQGQSVEEYVRGLVVAASAGPAPQPLPPDQWIASWRAWAAGHHRLPVVVDDSRDSIYAGRGE